MSRSSILLTILITIMILAITEHCFADISGKKTVKLRIEVYEKAWQINPKFGSDKNAVCRVELAEGDIIFGNDLHREQNIDTVYLFKLNKITDSTHIEIVFGSRATTQCKGQTNICRGDTLLVGVEPVCIDSRSSPWLTDYILSIDYSPFYDDSYLPDSTPYIAITSESVDYKKWKRDATTYYENGQFRSKCPVVLNNRLDWAKNGPYYEWAENGQMTLLQNYNMDTLVGQFKSWYANGHPKEEGQHISGRTPDDCRKDGHWRWWNEDGSLLAEGDFANGTGKSRYVNGRLRSEQYCADGRRTGVWKMWYPDGKPGYYKEYFNGYPSGGWREWDENGQILVNEHYINGLRDGVCRRWNKNGQLLSYTVYDKGIPYGYAEKWSDEGQILLQNAFDRVLGDRPFIKWEPTGLVTYMSQGPFKIDWDQSGNIKIAHNGTNPLQSVWLAPLKDSEGLRAKGLNAKKNHLGMTIVWANDTTVVSLKEYYRPDSCYLTEYYPNGYLKDKGNFDNAHNEKVGYWRYWNMKRLLDRKEFQKSKNEWYVKRLYLNGSVESEGNIIKGVTDKEVGIWKYYDDGENLIFEIDHDKTPPDTLYISNQ